jgi:hypothetical protein
LPAGGRVASFYWPGRRFLLAKRPICGIDFFFAGKTADLRGELRGAPLSVNPLG